MRFCFVSVNFLIHSYIYICISFLLSYFQLSIVNNKKQLYIILIIHRIYFLSILLLYIIVVAGAQNQQIQYYYYNNIIKKICIKINYECYYNIEIALIKK